MYTVINVLAVTSPCHRKWQVVCVACVVYGCTKVETGRGQWWCRRQLGSSEVGWTRRVGWRQATGGRQVCISLAASSVVRDAGLDGAGGTSQRCRVPTPLQSGDVNTRPARQAGTCYTRRPRRSVDDATQTPPLTTIYAPCIHTTHLLYAYTCVVYARIRCNQTLTGLFTHTHCILWVNTQLSTYPHWKQQMRSSD